MHSHHLLLIPALVLALTLGFADVSILPWVLLGMASIGPLWRSASAVTDNAEPQNQAADLRVTADQLRHIKQMERLAAVGQLSAGIAHEINNPVAYVGSNLHAIRADMDGLLRFVGAVDNAGNRLDPASEAYRLILSAYQDEGIADIVSLMPERVSDSLEGVDRISHIVRDMKRLMRGDQGPKSPSSINDELNAIINIARIGVGGELTLNVGLLDDCPPVVCNPALVGQVVLNILVNAIQAVDERYGEVSIYQRQHAHELEIVISDNGIGIGADTVARVFEPFYTTKSADEGTGMGLALSQQLIEEHGGRIELESELGVGSCFHIYLPLIAEESNRV